LVLSPQERKRIWNTTRAAREKELLIESLKLAIKVRLNKKVTSPGGVGSRPIFLHRFAYKEQKNRVDTLVFVERKRANPTPSRFGFGLLR
jgi:hypothetical protein